MNTILVGKKKFSLIFKVYVSWTLCVDVHKEFSGQLHKFMSCLTETAHHAKGHTVLYLPYEKRLTTPEGIGLAIKVRRFLVSFL